MRWTGEKDFSSFVFKAFRNYAHRDFTLPDCRKDLIKLRLHCFCVIFQEIERKDYIGLLKYLGERKTCMRIRRDFSEPKFRHSKTALPSIPIKIGVMFLVLQTLMMIVFASCTVKTFLCQSWVVAD